jgi:hypothetical protein
MEISHTSPFLHNKNLFIALQGRLRNILSVAILVLHRSLLIAMYFVVSKSSAATSPVLRFLAAFFPFFPNKI